jgi:membrane protein
MRGLLVNQTKYARARLRRVRDCLLKYPVVLLIFRTVQGSGNHDASQRAAGIAYYSLLSLFPLLLGLLAVFGFLLPSFNLQDALLKLVGNNFPGATDFLRQNIVNIIDLRGAMGALSIVLLFWSASAMFGAINLSINRVWEIRVYRPFFIRKASELAMVLSTGMLFIISLGASAVISILRRVLDFPVEKVMVLEVGSRLFAFLLILAIFLLLYKLIPNTKTHWRDIWPGALFAAILFEVARTLLVFYLGRFANYQLIYGSLASIIALLVWIYYSAYILVLGAEFTFQYGRRRYSNTIASGADK